MDLEVKIKEEPAWLEGTTNASLENFEPLSEVIALKEEVKSELTEPGSSQEDSLEPSEDTKEDIFIEEHADDQLLPYIKEETKSGSDVSNADHHPRDGRTRFRCNVCGKSFSRKYTLAVHTRSHTGETSIRGNISGKLFNDKCALQKQTLTHTKKKPHYCNLCGKSFNRKYNVVCHMRTHTGEKPYCCNICEKAFTSKVNLTCHLRSHTGEKPFCCNICEKSFTSKAHLTYHARSHTGERPYGCNVCGKSFRRKDHLPSHLQSHVRQDVVVRHLRQILHRGRHPSMLHGDSHGR